MDSFYQFIAIVTAVAANGVLALAVLDRRVRLKLTACLDHDGTGDVLRLRVANKSAFPVRLSFVGIDLKDGGEHRISGWLMGSHSPASGSPILPRVTWEDSYPLEFQGHESNRYRKDLFRKDLQSFVVRTVQGKQQYKVGITECSRA